MNDLQVNDVPKFLTPNPSDSTDAIVIPTVNPDSERYLIPLSLHGVTSYFPSRTPTTAEFESCHCFELTYESPDWDPHSTTFSTQEENASQGTNDGIACLTTQPSLRDTHSSFVEQLQNNILVTDPSAIAKIQTKQHKGIEPQVLARRWGIGIEAAINTINRTTQRGVRTVLHPSLSRRFWTNDRQLRYRRLPIDIFADTMFSDTKSRRSNTCAEVYCARNGWKRAFPMKTKAQAHETLSLLFARDGAPASIIVDGAKEQTMGNFCQKVREAGVHIKTTEPHSPWSNAAESAIRELKRGVGQKMLHTGAPKRLWDDCMELEAYIQSHTASSIYELHGEVPETHVSGETADISQICQHSWYDWIMFRDTTISFPDDKLQLGRYLGPSIDIGPAMTAKILKGNGQVVHRTTYRGLTPEEQDDPNHQRLRESFDKEVTGKLGPKMSPHDLTDADADTPEYETYADDHEGEHAHPIEEDTTPEESDEYVNAEVSLPKDGSMLSGRVIGRKRDSSGALKGTRNANPILDSRTYMVEFPDGEVTEYSANVIAQNMWAQCDLDGNQTILLDAIIDHRSNSNAITTADSFVYQNGRKHQRKTTAGWQLCVRWKDGSTSWEKLSALKESYPIEVAEYAVAQNIAHEPAYVWWVPYTLRRRTRIIAAVNKRYIKTTHKFGIRVPKTVEEAMAIDKENGNTLWMDAISKELKAVRVAFKVLDNDTNIPPGYQQIRCHFVFDVKMENFQCKARSRRPKR